MAAGREHLLHFYDARVSGRDGLRCLTMQAPAADVEQTEPALTKAVVALDAASPPLTKVVARPELHQLILVVSCPSGKSKIIVLGSDPPGTAAGQHSAVIRDVDLCICSINFFTNYNFALQAGQFRERIEWVFCGCVHGC